MDATASKKADEERQWIDDITAAVNEVNISSEEAAWRKPSIYTVSSFARSGYPNAFTPQVISFGPFHHGAENLKASEVHKHRALAHFLHRAGKQPMPFLCKLRSILQQLQDSYQGLDMKWKANPFDFLKMMLLDGCFLIETMQLVSPYIKRDMLLLENQFPLLAIKAILDVENNIETDSRYINNLVLKFFGEHLKVELRRLANHPLELYRESMLYAPSEEGPITISVGRETPMIMNAVELWESGIHFKSNKQSASLMSIKFDPNSGCLELPAISVHDGTEFLLLNMVAYEQIHAGIGNEITSFIAFMDALIDTEDDVKLLQKNKVISNFLGSQSHKAVADLFNSLGKVTVYDPNSKLEQVRYQVSEYYKKRAPKWLAYIRKQYWAYIRQQFSETPWAVVGVIAASIALVLTFVQTIYSVLSYHIGK